MKIQVGKYYKTIQGLKVKIVAINTSGNHRIIGYYVKNNMLQSWTETGKAVSSYSITVLHDNSANLIPDDLVSEWDGE